MTDSGFASTFFREYSIGRNKKGGRKMVDNAYRYSYTMPKGKKRFEAYAHGSNWAIALGNIHIYHPKRSNIIQGKEVIPC